jgi:hypothetical protein
VTQATDTPSGSHALYRAPFSLRSVFRVRPSNRRSLLLSATVLAVLQLSCGREVTGPGASSRFAHFALDPQMPALSALLESATSISSVVPFDRVRITAQRPDQSFAYDRTVPFPSSADSITLAVSVPLTSGSSSESGDGVPIALRIAYINAQGDTVFRGGPITAFVSASNANQTVSMPVSYSGIGSGATSVTLTPDSGTVVAGTSTILIGEARDTSGVIAGTPLLFYTPDTVRAQIANPAVGTVLWKPSRGTARIIALHPNGLLADTSVFTVSLPASKLVVSAGAAQSALAGTALPQPIVLRTLASDDVPVPGVVVNFSVSAGGGTLTAVQDTSDANGEVSVNWTLGTALGTQSIAASAPGLAPSPLTVSATALSGPTGVALNITSPIGASRYYAVVTGPGIATEVIQKLDASFARSTTLNVPLPAGNGYTIYVLAADSLTPLPDTLPTISAGKLFAGVNIPAGNTIQLDATLGSVSLTGTVPSFVTAGESFVADVTLDDASGLFHQVFTFINLYRSDTLPATDRGGSAVTVGGMQVLSATQKRFTAPVFRPSETGVIYSQFGGGVASSDRKVIFWVIGPSRQRNETLLTTNVTAASSGIRVNITAPIAVNRYLVAVDTGSGPIAWGSVETESSTSAVIEVPVPAGSNYRVRVAALDEFGFNPQLFAALTNLRSGGVLTGQSVAAVGLTDVNLSLTASTANPGVPSTGTVGVATPFSGTMRDPSLLNAAAPCLVRYSTIGPISINNLGTLLTTACTISNRQADGSFTVTGTLPALTAPGTIDAQVFTSVIGYTPSGGRIEMLHLSLSSTTINP